jgi:glutamine amidotransferase
MITLVDYGLGNIQAFANIYKRLNIPVSVAKSASELELSEKIILPGVGAFDWAMTKLNNSGMRDCLDRLVLDHRRPVLGVCVGMQMMARRSDEGEMQGLGWIDGEVLKLDASRLSDATRLPHMGWNDVHPTTEDSLFRSLESPRFYFLHSYYFQTERSADVLATTAYGAEFASAVARENVFGTQFHPEKSHQWGVSLLKNFAEL